MVKTIKDVFSNLPNDEGVLVTVSDELWKLGSVDEIKEKVSPALFIAHISMNIIGNQQCDGWESIFRYHSQMFPYIPQALDAMYLTDIKEEFLNVMTALSPNFSVDNLPNDFYERIEVLDDLSDSVWGLRAPEKGWSGVLKYIKENYNE